MTRRQHRDPTGMFATAAQREAEQLFTKHPTLGVGYRGDRMIARVIVCGGQAEFAGRKYTRGCLYPSLHAQPCPGGPLVYQIVRREHHFGFQCIEASGDSWRAALDSIINRRLKERADAIARSKRK